MIRKFGKKQRLRSILDDNAGVTSSISKNSLSANESIQRGRAAVAEAEENIRVFEEYLQSSSASQGVEDDNNLVLDVGPDDMNWVEANEKMNSECSLDELLASIDPIVSGLSNAGAMNVTTDLVEQMMRDGEVRMKRDERISSMRVKGDFALKGFSGEIIVNDVTVKSKPKRNFDPKQLSAARRAAVKESRTLRYGSKMEENEVKQFKALPLPGGGIVNNNPYALTQAARGKMNERKRADGDDNTVDTFANARLDASAILGNDISFSSIPSNAIFNSPLPIKRKQSTISKDIYSATTNFVSKEFEDEPFSEASDSSVDQKDVAGLHQQISRLQAELNDRRKKCLKTIYSLEDETRCNSINDIGIPELQKEFGKNNEGNDRDSMQNTSQNYDMSHGDDVANVCADLQGNSDYNLYPNSDENDNHRKLPMYARQKAWLEDIERKKSVAKEREEQNIIKGLTGKPNLKQAKASWSKAKEEHAGLVKTAREREAMLQRNKMEREMQRHLQQMKEADAMQALAREHARSVKKGIDRGMQEEYVDKLSRPTHRVKVEQPLVNNPTIAHDNHRQDDQVKIEKELCREPEQDAEDKITVSFADMDDHEFAKMVKKIQARATKEIRTKTATSDNVSMMGKIKPKDKSVHRNHSARKKPDINFSPYESRN
jgi:hypothetical protein